MANIFGTMPDGTPVYSIPLCSGKLRCEIISFGAALRSLWVPNRDGTPIDIALGLDRLEDYLAHDAHFGATIGRFANRIGDSSFELDGIRYALPANDGPNHLHGGPLGFDRQVWIVEETSADAAVLSLVSPDGQEGYPGTMETRVRYQLTEDTLIIQYAARCDKNTLCNLTNHTYFNLSGHDSGSVEGQLIRLNAAAYTPTDARSIPTGQIAPVDGTPMDLRALTKIGAHIDDDFEQLRFAGGYDHNWVIDGADGTIRIAASAVSQDSGIRMDVYSTMPGIQFYTGNYLSGRPVGKGGAIYARRSGFCLETQYFPDAPHHPSFPSAILRSGETYRQETHFRLGTGRHEDGLE